MNSIFLLTSEENGLERLLDIVAPIFEGITFTGVEGRYCVKVDDWHIYIALASDWREEFESFEILKIEHAMGRDVCAFEFEYSKGSKYLKRVLWHLVPVLHCMIADDFDHLLPGSEFLKVI